MGHYSISKAYKYPIYYKYMKLMVSSYRGHLIIYALTLEGYEDLISAK